MNIANTLFCGVKNLFYFISSTTGLIHRNLFLFGRLTLLAVASIVAGIVGTPLLSFFDKGSRDVAWYITNIVPLGGLLTCSLFVLYLIIHILEKQNQLEVKKAQAEQTVRAKETEEKEYFPYREERPRTEKLLTFTKEKLLRLPWKKAD